MAEYTAYGQVGKDAVSYGLSQAKNWLEEDERSQSPYPGYTERQAPVQMDYGVEYQANQNPYQMVGGISQGQDWGQFKQDMRQPVMDTYDQNLRDLDTRFAGSGLYGSRGYGLHDDSIAKAGESRARGLVSADTAAMNLYGQDLDRMAQQQEAAAKFGLMDAERRQQYGQNQFNWDYSQQQMQNDFQNQEAARQDAYNLQDYYNEIDRQRQPFMDYLALASGGAPTANQIAANDANLAMANRQADAQNSAGWASAIGSVGGGLLGSDSLDNLWDGSGFELFDAGSWF